VSAVTLFVALATGVVVWWLVARRLTAKPWETAGDIDDQAGAAALRSAPARVGLWVFLAVASSLFTLFISAYSMRMHHGDWTALTEPGLLWLNTAVLVLSSVALQSARNAVLNGQAAAARTSLLAGGLLALAFLAGQLLAWQQLHASGQFMASSPATAFFYLLTAVHGLHLLGGLWVWGRTSARFLGGAELVDVRLSIELTSVYWHYLLLVWLVLFALLLAT